MSLLSIVVLLIVATKKFCRSANAPSQTPCPEPRNPNAQHRRTVNPKTFKPKSLQPGPYSTLVRVPKSQKRRLATIRAGSGASTETSCKTVILKSSRSKTPKTTASCNYQGRELGWAGLGSAGLGSAGRGWAGLAFRTRVRSAFGAFAFAFARWGH